VAKKVRLKKSQTEKINKFVELLKQQGVNISKIILFGSHIEPVPLSPDDLSDKYSSFSQEINRYGIDIGIKGT